jgi:Ni/Fe-hydrogenase subunit HybB-like protein
VIVMAFGAVATWIRFFHGLGASTNLSDEFPWGLWVGFDVLCGVMLAAGGFTLMATVHIFNVKKYKPIARPALLTVYLGYLLVCAALLFDLGKPWRIWHPLIMWNPHSVMFEVGWCVTLYTTVLTLEFLPIVFERFRMEKPLRDAVLMNGTLIHGLDFDDTSIFGRVHPSSFLVPCVLGVAAYAGASGKEMLAAYVAGMECAIRIGAAPPRTRETVNA